MIHTVAWQRAGDRAEGSRAWRNSWRQVMRATVPLLAAEPPARARTTPLPPQAYDRGFLRRYCAMAPTPLQVCQRVAGLGKVGGRLRGRLRQPPVAVAPRRVALLSPHPPVFEPCAPPPQMMEDLEQLKVLENGYRMKVGGLALGPQGWGAASVSMMARWEDGHCMKVRGDESGGGRCVCHVCRDSVVVSIPACCMAWGRSACAAAQHRPPVWVARQVRCLDGFLAAAPPFCD